MYPGIQIMRVALVVSAIAISVGAGVDKNNAHFQVRLAPMASEGYEHVNLSTAQSFSAKSPRGGTVCSWVGPSTGNWEDAANWSCGHVPTSTNDVEIFTGNVTLNSVADVHSVIVGNGAGLTVTSGKSLNVNH